MLTKVIKAFVVKFMSSVAGFYIVYLVTSVLSVEEAGEYFFFVAIATAIGNLGRLGFDFRAIRLTTGVLNSGQDVQKESWRILQTVFKFYLIIFVFILLLQFFGLVEVVFVIAACFMSVTMLVGFMYQGLGKITVMQIYHGVLFNVVFILLYWVVRSSSIKFDEEIMKLVFVVSWGVALVIGLHAWSTLYKYVNNYNNLSINNDLIINKNVLSNNVLMMTSQWGLPILLGLMISKSDLAVYMVALKISTFLALLVLILSSVVTPKIAICIQDKNYRLLKNIFIFSSVIVVLMSLPYVFAISAFPKKVLSYFGAEYSTDVGVQVLWVLSIGQFIYSLSGVLSMFLNLSGNEKHVLISNFWSVVFLVIFGGILVYRYGVYGAAVSQSLALIVMVLISVFYASRNIKKYKR